MDLLGIGVPEVIVIIILALIFIGPRDLPRIAARAGKLLRDLRMMSEGFTTEWRREMAVLSEVEELKELKEELVSTKKALQEAGQEIRSTVRIEAKDLDPETPPSAETKAEPVAAGKISKADADSQADTPAAAEAAEADLAASEITTETSDQESQKVVETVADVDREPVTDAIHPPQSQANTPLADSAEEAEATIEVSDRENQTVIEDDAIALETDAIHSPQLQTDILTDDKGEAVEVELSTSVVTKEPADQGPQNNGEELGEGDLETETRHSPHLVASAAVTEDKTEQGSDNHSSASSKHNGQAKDEVEVKAPKSAPTEDSSGSE